MKSIIALQIMFASTLFATLSPAWSAPSDPGEVIGGRLQTQFCCVKPCLDNSGGPCDFVCQNFGGTCYGTVRDLTPKECKSSVPPNTACTVVSTETCTTVPANGYCADINEGTPDSFGACPSCPDFFETCAQSTRCKTN